MEKGAVKDTAHHRHGVELLQAAHRTKQQDHNPASLDRLDRPREKVGRQRLEVLEDQHAESLTQNLSRVLVVPASTISNISNLPCEGKEAKQGSRVADVGDGEEELERRLLVRLYDPALDVPLDLGLALLAVAGRRASGSARPRERAGVGEESGSRRTW